MKNRLKVTARSGDEFEVDISDEACQRFGCCHGDIIIDPNGDIGKVMGVAPMFAWCTDDQGEDVLWYIRIKDSSVRVGFYHPLEEGEYFRVVET